MIVPNLIKEKMFVPRGVWVKHPIIMISPNGWDVAISKTRTRIY